jgi:NAD(P)-dependent dehydrogenase (short-subunit alcohol dehydrogenase family)
MEIDLKNRVALVTGSSKGLGLKIATALGTSGAKVTICARNEEYLLKAQKEMEALGITCSFLVTDLTRPESAKETILHVIQNWGGLDILVNNVGGIKKTGRYEELSDEDWYDCFSLNTMTTVSLSREAIPYLKESRYPRIINISSVVATQPGDYNPHYSACKLAIVNLTKHLSNSLAKEGILVNCVSPGIIHTEGWDHYVKNKSDQENRPIQDVAYAEENRVVNGVPLHRLGCSKEVVPLVVFLASDAASFMTGENIRVDGGKVKAV